MAENNTPLKEPTWQEKLHAFKMNLQRHLVIGKHKLHKKRQAGTRASVRWLRARPVYHRLGHLLYDLGFQAEYLVVRTGRALRNGFYHALFLSIRLAGWLKKKCKQAGHLVWEEFLRAPVVFVRGMWRISRNAVHTARTNGLRHAFRQSLSNLQYGVHEYGRLVPRTLAYVIPVITGVICWGFVQTSLQQQFVLAVDVDGENVGYVLSESVFESAKNSVNERINYAAAGDSSWDITATYKVEPIGEDQEILTETGMADAILRTSEDQIQEGTALYIDHELSRITTDGDELREQLEAMKAPYETGEDNVIVGFNHDVDLVDGIYFNESFTDVDEVIDYLHSDQIKQELYTLVAGDSISLIASKNGLTQAELYALNPGLTVDSKLFPGDQLVVQKQETVLEIRIRKTVTYPEVIPYRTVKSKSDQYAFGTTKTVVKGQEGEQMVTAEQTFNAAGELLQNDILSVEVTREPVNEEIIQGTRMPSGSVGQIGSGTLVWPVPNYKYVSRWATGRHKGVDICGPVGTPIYAADAGVVVKAGMNRAGAGNNYGLSIIIDHGNGIKTLYAHASRLYVSPGQSVSQGQHIADIGMTGRTSGPHLHFEIIQNGAKIPPQNVFPGKR